MKDEMLMYQPEVLKVTCLKGMEAEARDIVEEAVARFRRDLQKQVDEGLADSILGELRANYVEHERQHYHPPTRCFLTRGQYDVLRKGLSPIFMATSNGYRPTVLGMEVHYVEDTQPAPLEVR